MIKANYKETGDSVGVVHLRVGEGHGFSQKGVQPSYGSPFLEEIQGKFALSLLILRENMPSGRPVFNVWLNASRGVLNKVI